MALAQAVPPVENAPPEEDASEASSLSEEEPTLLPGWQAEYRAAAGQTAESTSADATLVKRAEGSISLLPQMLPGFGFHQGPVTALWRGQVLFTDAGTYLLAVHLRGLVTVTVDGKPVIQVERPDLGWQASPPLAMEVGQHEVTVQMQAPAATASLSLFWTGPDHDWERLGGRFVLHPSPVEPAALPQGHLLARALRCGRCHAALEDSPPFMSADLSHAASTLEPDWIINWLTGTTPEGTNAGSQTPQRRMPHFQLLPEQARAIAAFMHANSMPLPPATEAETPETHPPQAPPIEAQNKPNAGQATAAAPDARADATPPPSGKVLFQTLGCLGCHRQGNIGNASLFSGGDLTVVGNKRPASFFEAWLADPRRLNARHRMPQFPLDELERAQLAEYLASLRDGDPTTAVAPLATTATVVAQGKQLIEQHRCQACHALAGQPTAPPDIGISQAFVSELATRLALGKNTANSGEAAARAACYLPGKHPSGQPQYRLDAAETEAIDRFLLRRLTHASAAEQTPNTNSPKQHAPLSSALALEERNCVGCHARGPELGLLQTWSDHAEHLPVLPDEFPALLPPALDGVGDKLLPQALERAILAQTRLRPWLRVRMPRFDLGTAEVALLARDLQLQDEMPEISAELRQLQATHVRSWPTAAQDVSAGSLSTAEHAERLAAGTRLVTADGFGCTSCHAIGKSQPVTEIIAARGTPLDQLGERLKRSWFDRWLRDPLRNGPRIEMPSVRLPVQGVLDNDLDRQKEAVWYVLNRPDFNPPPPNPLQVVRARNLQELQEPAQMILDVTECGSQTFVRPVVIGLGNRHNLLFDLEHNSLGGWWLGDTARQRTRGKSWYWEAGSAPLLVSAKGTSEFLLQIGENAIAPTVSGQTATQLVAVHPQGTALHVEAVLDFPMANGMQPPENLRIVTEQRFEPLWPAGGVWAGFRRTWSMHNVPVQAAGRLFPVPPGLHWTQAQEDPGTIHATTDAGQIRLTLLTAAGQAWHVTNDGQASVSLAAGSTSLVTVDYRFSLTPDQFPVTHGPAVQAVPKRLTVAPGFEALELPLARNIMPTGLAWNPAGELIFTSLEGRVWKATDTDLDHIEDACLPIAGHLAAPYGLDAANGGLYVIHKPGLLHLTDPDEDGYYEDWRVAADGWGYTADYHDWAVGLPKDDAGHYLVALPCQQDDRAFAASHLRGTALRLIPQPHALPGEREFALEPIASGLRFPMGLVWHSTGGLFATDNQGNYNPFNELNHLLPGRRYGFINRWEVKQGLSFPAEEPAVNIPHPWTRSVNGLCELRAPGPFQGQLLACEYDTRRLVRMSVERVADTYQGAVYPFSMVPDDPAKGLQGPVVCQESPLGDIYVGNMRDSGWGGGANTGSIVRLQRQAELPPGIALVTSTSLGLRLQFTQPVSKDALNSRTNFQVDSYRRESTPEYGGPDLDRTEYQVRVSKVSAAGDAVELQITPWREGYVYEIRVRGLVPAGAAFFPAEAHYTLRRVPPE